MRDIYLIGCGGVGSWLAPSLALLVESPMKLILVDGDTLEEGNLNRQLFTRADIGRNKAEALAERYGTRHEPNWFSAGKFPIRADDWIIGCVDNNAARRDILEETQQDMCQCIIAANETHSAEAYYYHAIWEGTACDPVNYYPELDDEDGNDPRARAIGCTGEIQRENRQLVSANFMAAALAQHLFVLWAMEAPKFDPEVVAKLPHHLRANLTRLETIITKRPRSGDDVPF